MFASMKDLKQSTYLEKLRALQRQYIALEYRLNKLIELETGNPSIVAGLLEYGRESLDVLHSSVVIDFVVLGAEPEVQLIKELPVDASERKVGHMVFFFEEESKLVLQNLVAEHGLPAVALLLHKSLVVFDETVEQRHNVGRLAFSRSVEYRTLN